MHDNYSTGLFSYKQEIQDIRQSGAHCACDQYVHSFLIYLFILKDDADKITDSEDNNCFYSN